MKLRTLVGIAVTVMALLLSVFYCLQMLSTPIDKSINFHLFQIIFNGLVSLIMLLILLNMRKSFCMRIICEYLQLIFLLISATTSFFQNYVGIIGVPLFLLIIFLGFYYEAMGNKSLSVLVLYITSVTLYSAYSRGHLVGGFAVSFFYVFYYYIIYKLYKSFIERETIRRTQMMNMIENLHDELNDKEALIEQMNAVHYNVKNYHLTPCEKELLDCIRLNREVGNKELSTLMGKSESTIRNRIHTICKKLGFHRRMKLLTFVMESPPDIEELPVIEE